MRAEGAGDLTPPSVAAPPTAAPVDLVAQVDLTAQQPPAPPSARPPAVLAISIRLLPGQEHAGPTALGLAAVGLGHAHRLLETPIAVPVVPDTDHLMIAAPEPPVGSRQVTPAVGASDAAGTCEVLTRVLADADAAYSARHGHALVVVGYRLWERGLLALHRTAQRQGGRCPRPPGVAWVDLSAYVPLGMSREAPTLAEACARFGVPIQDQPSAVAEAVGHLALCLLSYGHMPPLAEAAESQHDLAARLFRPEQMRLCE